MLGKSVLVAEIPSLHARLQSVLGAYDCQYVTSLGDAKAALEKTRFNLVVVCVLFNESRMFDLLSHILNNPRLSQTPIVCLRGDEGSRDRQWEGMDFSVKAIGARFFLDLRKVPDTPHANARLAGLFDHLLALEAELNAYRADEISEQE